MIEIVVEVKLGVRIWVFGVDGIGYVWLINWSVFLSLSFVVVEEDGVLYLNDFGDVGVDLVVVYNIKGIGIWYEMLFYDVIMEE